MIPGPYRNLALIGFMGAGKSSTGRLLAQRLGWDFVDADAAIEAAAGRPIARIFEEDGEPAFRALERAEVARALAEDDGVLAPRHAKNGARDTAGESFDVRGRRCRQHTD